MAGLRTLDVAINDDGRNDLATFARATGVRIAFCSAEGEELESGDARGLSSFCSLLRTDPSFDEDCRACDREHRAKAQVAHGVVCYRCHAGLTEAIAAVRSSDVVLGYAMIGQIRTSTHLPPELRDRMDRRDSRHLLASLSRAYATLPLVDEPRLQAITTLFRQQVERLVARNEVRIRGRLALERLRTIIADRYDQALSVGTVAAELGMGVSTLEHLLRRELGTTFTRMLRAERIACARTLLETRGELSVAEVAAAVGYDDAFYFSRLFRRACGVSPTEWRARRPGEDVADASSPARRSEPVTR